jgi:nicotinate dehydrogenase subunit A
MNLPPRSGPQDWRDGDVMSYDKCNEFGCLAADEAGVADITVNGCRLAPDLPRSTPLLSYLRNDLELNSPKFGCGLGECGACTVLVDGRAARACVLTLENVIGREVITLEGLARPVGQAAVYTLDPVQQAFIACAAAQCGYCLSGMIMTTKAFLDQSPDPSEIEIRDALRHNLCRCGAHVEILEAVRRAIALRGEQGDGQ